MLHIDLCVRSIACDERATYNKPNPHAPQKYFTFFLCAQADYSVNVPRLQQTYLEK